MQQNESTQLDAPRSQRAGSPVCWFLRVMASVISMCGNFLPICDTFSWLVPQSLSHVLFMKQTTTMCNEASSMGSQRWDHQSNSCIRFLLKIAPGYGTGCVLLNCKGSTQIGLFISGCKHERAVNFPGVRMSGSVLKCAGTVILTLKERVSSLSLGRNWEILFPPTVLLFLTSRSCCLVYLQCSAMLAQFKMQFFPYCSMASTQTHCSLSEVFLEC